MISCCCVLLFYDMVRLSSVLTSLGFHDVNRGSVWLLSITLYGNLPRNFRLYDVTFTSMKLKVFTLLCIICYVYRNIDIVSYQYDFLHIGAHQYGWLNSNIQILPVSGGGMKM